MADKSVHREKVEFKNTVAIKGSDAAAATAGATGATKTPAFSIRKSDAADGYYVYQEEVSLVAAAYPSSSDNKVIVRLSKLLPANSVIVSAALQATELSNLGTVAVNLLLSATTDTAQDASCSSPTEVIGAATLAASQSTGALAASSGGSLGDVEATTFAVPVAAKTAAYVCHDGTNTTGAATSGKVLVTIKYFGSAAPA